MEDVEVTGRNVGQLYVDDDVAGVGQGLPNAVDRWFTATLTPPQGQTGFAAAWQAGSVSVISVEARRNSVKPPAGLRCVA